MRFDSAEAFFAPLRADRLERAVADHSVELGLVQPLLAQKGPQLLVCEAPRLHHHPKLLFRTPVLGTPRASLLLRSP